MVRKAMYLKKDLSFDSLLQQSSFSTCSHEAYKLVYHDAIVAIVTRHNPCSYKITLSGTSGGRGSLEHAGRCFFGQCIVLPIAACLGSEFLVWRCPGSLPVAHTLHMRRFKALCIRSHKDIPNPTWLNANKLQVPERLEARLAAHSVKKIPAAVWGETLQDLSQLHPQITPYKQNLNPQSLSS